MKTQILDMEHFQDVHQLLENRNKFSKQPNEGPVWDYLIASTMYCLENQDRDRIIGTFDNGILKAILCQTILKEHPIWFMKYYATEKNTIALGKGYGPYLSECFKRAMNDAEAKGYYDFWFSVPVAYAKNGPRMQKTSAEWMRYEVYTDAIVKANEYPGQELHRLAYGKILKPHDVFIRHAVLKQEHRPVPLTR